MEDFELPEGAKFRGNFGSKEDALEYCDDAGIPGEYCIIDDQGNLWIIG